MRAKPGAVNAKDADVRRASKKIARKYRATFKKLADLPAQDGATNYWAPWKFFK